MVEEEITEYHSIYVLYTSLHWLCEPWLPCSFVISVLKIFIWVFIWKSYKDREIEISSHCWCFFQMAETASQNWLKLKPGASNSFRVSNVGCKAPGSWTIFCCLSRHISTSPWLVISIMKILEQLIFRNLYRLIMFSYFSNMSLCQVSKL